MSGGRQAEANGMLQIAVRRMASCYPFHANLLALADFTCDPPVETIGVTVRGARLQFLYAPDFVCCCDFDQLAAVLHHEVNHVLFGQLLVDPGQFPDRNARLIAEEVTVNEWVLESLPGNPITLGQYPDLPPAEDTDTRYRRLAENSARGGTNPVQTGREMVPPGRKSVQSGHKSANQAEKSGGSSAPRNSLRPLDNHDVWREARQNPALSRLVIASAVRGARAATSESDWKTLPAELRNQMAAGARGRLPGNTTYAVGDRGDGTIKWRRVLQRLRLQPTQRQPALHRPSRRLPELLGMVPGQATTAGRPRIMAMIDTSASMDDEALSRVAGELARLGKLAEISVVECDTRTQEIYPFRGQLKHVRGRGGTDLRPPFERRLLARLNPDVIIVFTDGGRPVPATPPRISTVWCLPAEAEVPAKWGTVVRMERWDSGRQTH